MSERAYPPGARRGAIVLALAASACAGASSGHPAAPTAVPGLRIDVARTHYVVHGHTPRDLARSLDREGPHHAGRRWYGLTHWELTWRYRARERGSRCEVASPRLDVEITTLLPRWADLREAGPTLALDWDLLLARLERHERTHREIVARESETALRSLRGLGAPDCATLRRRVDRVAAAVQARLQEENLRFDRATDFGRSGEVVAAGR